MPPLSPDPAALSPFTREDRIYLGEGLFETLRVQDGKPCYPDLHWQRLHDSAARLRIAFELPYAHWLQRLQQCLHEAKEPVNGLKALLSGGRSARGLLTTGTDPQLVLTAFCYSPITAPLTLVSSSWRRDRHNPVYGLKSINYLEAIMARRQAAERGADDVLFYNTEGEATETTVANLFMISGNRLYTSPLSCGLLAGIIRQRLVTKAGDWGVVCQELPLTQHQLYNADALFVCNALQGVQAVQRLDNTAYDCHHPLLLFLSEKLKDDARA
ncbi:aminotransferase class IV [Legionella taurinensis]|uniref:Aminodeoxychorismate lyase n=1 Tax=Legionella taurinensis TaxID=70611 RepID=A0A3A5L5L2_9GAMM|nr:aminotransferase class IV [Legionella taurinensis]RJT48083.1 4-amino-4-deoxychorismate lyase [Legionella taurinensis]RJT68297.1 4-amino-4-deoxychorismate lyase [Legionella taurinensis]STY25513.1 4-amino-4-deoxychorismate lyase [Legionella taurinensis]